MDLVGSRNGFSNEPFLREFDELQEEINRLFETTRVPEPRGIFEGAYSPAIDVIETSEGYQVLCDLPGLDMQGIEISISGNVLTLKGEKKRESKNGSARHYREDTTIGRFQRTLHFPLPVDPDKAEAVLKNGVLSVTVPKREEVKARQITVKAS